MRSPNGSEKYNSGSESLANRSKLRVVSGNKKPMALSDHQDSE